MRWVVTTQPQRTGSDGAGSHLHLPALVPPVPVCPLCTGTRARGACALAPGAAPGALPWISQPFCQGELNCTFTTRTKERARVTTCTQMPLPMSPSPLCSSPGGAMAGLFHQRQVLSQRSTLLLLPSAPLVPSSKLSPLLCHKQFPFPRVPRLPDVLETPSCAAATRDVEEQSKNWEGIPPRSACLSAALLNEPLAAGLRGTRTGLCLPVPWHLPPNTLRSPADLQENLGLCLKQPISTPCNCMRNIK